MFYKKMMYLFVVAVTFLGANLVSASFINGSFNEDLTYWRGRWVKLPKGGFPRVAIDTEKLGNGEKCLLIDSTGKKGRYQLTQKMYVVPGKKYKVKFEVFIENEQAVQSQFRIQVLDKNRKWLSYLCATPIKFKESKWVKYEFDFVAPENAENIVVEFNFYTPTKIWLNNVNVIDLSLKATE